MIEVPHVAHAPTRSTAVVRLVIPREQIREHMGPAIGEVLAALAAQGSAPAGPVYSHHFRIDPEVFDFEVGVPVATPVQASGRVVPAELAAGKIARTIHRGPYEALAGAWAEFEAWIEAEGLPRAPDLWEVYLVGPESGADTAQWRTELNHRLLG